MTATLIPNADDLRIAEQLAMAKAMRERGMTDKGGSGMAGQVYVVGNQYGNLAQSLGGAILGAKAVNDRDQLYAGREQARKDWLGQMPSATETQHYDPVSNPGTGPLQEGMEVPKDPRVLERAMYAWGIQAPEGMEGVRNHVLTQAVTAPQRQAELEQKAADRMQELQLKMLENRATQQERQEFQEKLLKMQLEGKKDMLHIAAALRPPPAPHSPPTQMTDQGLLERQPDGTWKPVKVGDTVAGKPFAPKSPSANDLKVEKLAGAPGRIDKIIEEASKNEASFGIVPATASMLPNAVGSRITSLALKEPQRIARANVMRQAAQEIHELYGAALSRGEAGRANSFAPNPNDDYDTIMSKLKSAKQYAESINPGAASAPTVPSGGRRKYNSATGDFE